MNNASPEIKALMVDDESSLLDILGDIARIVGVTPILALDGETALKLFKKENPDIVISDIHMPKLNGIELMKRIKKIDPDKPVILITGYSHYKKLVESSNVKPDGYLEKPFNIQQVINLLLENFPQLK